ncbi:SAG family member, partial [Eimeria maxima]
MRRFCFAVLAGTAAAVPALLTEAQAGTNKTFSAVDCSEQMNKEREPMGFPKFTVLDTSTPITGEDKVNTTNLCANIKEGTDPGAWLTKTSAGLSIAAARQSSAQGDCAAATKQWKGALKTIGDSLPPAYTPGQDIYKSLDVVSLMSLYTPKDGVAVACTVIQCPPKSSTGGASDSGGSNTDSEGGKPPTTTPTPPNEDGEEEEKGEQAVPSAGVGDVDGAGGGDGEGTPLLPFVN